MFNSVSRWLTMAVERIAGRPKLEEAIVAQYITGRLRFAPYVEPREGETAAMRASYRMLVKEPTVKSCLDSLIGGIASGELDVPPKAKDSRSVEIAEYCKDLIYNCSGGLVNICSAVIGNGLIEGYSVSEPVWEIEDRGRWTRKSVLRQLKPKPTDDYWFEVDKFWNVTSVISRLTVEPYPVTDFVYWRHQNYTASPHGTSLLRACYRSAWMLDTVWKLRGIGLERYTLPAMIAKYPMGNDPVRVSMENAVRKIKAAGWATVPLEAALEPLQMSLRGTSDFEAAVKDLKEEICIAMLGGSLQTLQGFTPGGRGSSQEHAGVMQTRIWMLTMAICEVIYRQIFVPAVEWNYGKHTPVPHPVIGGINDDDIKRSLDLDEQMQRMGYPVSMAGVSERTRRAPGYGDDILKPPQSQQQPQGGLGGMLGGQGPSDGLFGPTGGSQGPSGGEPAPGPKPSAKPEGDKPAGPVEPLQFSERPVVVVNHIPRDRDYHTYSAQDWQGPMTGPHGGHYWQNVHSGEKVYQASNPGGTGDEQSAGNQPEKPVVDHPGSAKTSNGKTAEATGKEGKTDEVPEHLANPQPIIPGSKPWGLKGYNVKGYTDKVKAALETIKQGVGQDGISKEAFDEAYGSMKQMTPTELYAFMALLGVKGNVKNERVSAYIKSKILSKLTIKPETQQNLVALQSYLSNPLAFSADDMNKVSDALKANYGKVDLTAFGLDANTPKDDIPYQVWSTWNEKKNVMLKAAAAEAAKAKSQAKPVAAPPATPAKTPDEKAFAPSLADYKVNNNVSGSLGGSTGAKKATFDGKDYVVKSGASDGHIKAEYAANQMYDALGVPVVQTRLYPTDSGKSVQVGAFIKGDTLDSYLGKANPAQKEAMTKAIAKHFVMDALLGNWDVIGSGRDNIIVKDGVPYRIDNGGSLNYRAQGALKHSWGSQVTELDTMRDPSKNPATAAFFGHLTDQDIQQQINDIVAKQHQIVSKAPVDQQATIAARIKNLQQWKPKPKAGSSKVPLGQGTKDFPADDVVRTLGKEPPRTVNLSDDETKALDHYTGTTYGPLNEALRKIPPGVLAGTEAFTHKHLTTAFENVKKQPFKEPVVVMRGIHTGSYYTGNKLVDTLEAGLSKKQNVVMNGYTSTSTNPKASKSFGSGGILMEIKTQHGLPAGAQGVSGENEVLLGHGWQYRVLGKKQIYLQGQNDLQPTLHTVYQLEHIPDWEGTAKEPTAKPAQKKKAWSGVFN